MRQSLSFALLTTIIIAGFVLVSFIHFKPVNASTENSDIPIPSIPEFTLRYIDLSYDVPPTYGIDQFTGKNVIIQDGRHVENRSVAFKIKNQPFTSYNDSSSNFIGLYYNFKFKGHFGDEWNYYPFFESGGTTHRYSTSFYPVTDQSPKLISSNSEYTDIFLGLPFLFGAFNPSVGSQVDFQVQALIGYIEYSGDGFFRYNGQRSDWSSTKTITVGESQTPTFSPTITPTPTPTPEPTYSPSLFPTPTSTPISSPPPELNPNPGFNFPMEYATGGIVAVVIIGAVVFFLRRK